MEQRFSSCAFSKGFFFLFLFLLSISFSRPLLATSFNSLSFNPATDVGPYLVVQGSQTLGPFGYAASLTTEYSKDSATLFAAGGDQVGTLIDDAIMTHLGLAVGLTEWMNLGVLVSAAPYQEFVDLGTGQTESDFQMGDLRLEAKFRLLDHRVAPLGIAVLPFVTFPTGSAEHLTSAENMTFGGLFILESPVIKDRLQVAANIGVDYGQGNLFAGFTQDEDYRLLYGLGLNVKLIPSLDLIAEMDGWTLLSHFTCGCAGVHNLEVDAALRWHTPVKGFSVTAGGGTTIRDGLGGPDYRGFLQVAYTRSKLDQFLASPVVPNRARLEGLQIVTDKIHFSFEQAVIEPASKEVLDDLAALIINHPQLCAMDPQAFASLNAPQQKTFASYLQNSPEAVTEAGASDGVNTGASSMAWQSWGPDLGEVASCMEPGKTGTHRLKNCFETQGTHPQAVASCFKKNHRGMGGLNSCLSKQGLSRSSFSTCLSRHGEDSQAFTACLQAYGAQPEAVASCVADHSQASAGLNTCLDALGVEAKSAAVCVAHSSVEDLSLDTCLLSQGSYQEALSSCLEDHGRASDLLSACLDSQGASVAGVGSCLEKASGDPQKLEACFAKKGTQSQSVANCLQLAKQDAPGLDQCLQTKEASLALASACLSQVSHPDQDMQACLHAKGSSTQIVSQCSQKTLGGDSLSTLASGSAACDLPAQVSGKDFAKCLAKSKGSAVALDQCLQSEGASAAQVASCLKTGHAKPMESCLAKQVALPKTLQAAANTSSGLLPVKSGVQANLPSALLRGRVRIEGHTDKAGCDATNQGLSVRRAQAVEDYLVSQGVPHSCLYSTGYGEARPIASNRSYAGRAVNRRVEFFVDDPTLSSSMVSGGASPVYPESPRKPGDPFKAQPECGY